MAEGSAVLSLMVMGMVIIFGFIILVVMLYNSRSNRLEVRIPTNKGYQVEKIYWTIEKRDKDDKSLWWISVPWQKKLKIPDPPPECCDYTRRGKKYVVVKRLSDDEFIFCRDKALSEEDLMEKERRSISQVFQPFSVTQRQTLVHQYIKANADKPPNWLKENGMNLAFGSMMFIIILVGIIYWADINEVSLENQRNANSLMDKSRGFLDELTGGGSLTPSGQQKGGVVQIGTEKPPTG